MVGVLQRFNQISGVASMILQCYSLMHHFAEIAEWVLNKCALSKAPQSDTCFLNSGEHLVLRESDQTEAVPAFYQQDRVAIEETDFGGLERMFSIEGNDNIRTVCLN